MTSALNVSIRLLAALLVPLSTAAAIVAYNYLQQQSSAQGDISVEQAMLLIETRPDLVIVDVRTPEEYETGYMEGAINISVTSIDRSMRRPETAGQSGTRRRDSSLL